MSPVEAILQIVSAEVGPAQCSLTGYGRGSIENRLEGQCPTEMVVGPVVAVAVSESAVQTFI